MNQERDLCIAYSLLPFLTPNRTRLLRETFESLGEIAHTPSRVLEGLLRIEPAQAELVKNPLRREARERVTQLGATVITLADEDYPALLREIPDPPLTLHFRGDLALLREPCVAVVGSRRASPYGVNAAERLARDLTGAGAVVVSGLARGIDGAAHSAALDARGRTIAILGSGIDVVYPRSHQSLYRRITREGLVLSEFPPGTAPTPENFPIRNRIISGISLGTIIVEATGRSGSLITARTAAEQGREVFAVPGSIFSAGSEGPNRLIQYGAKLVHDITDVLEELPGALHAPQKEDPPPPDTLRDVLDVLTREEATHVDEAAAKLNRTPGAIAESLLQLELGGWVRALPGARYVRTR